ncbi:MAG: hypothetical protein IT449_01950 [Phycisphaerales bacterium]|nr:hypothetical protein [Phycisphaerales bacterium]
MQFKHGNIEHNQVSPYVTIVNPRSTLRSRLWAALFDSFLCNILIHLAVVTGRRPTIGEATTGLVLAACVMGCPVLWRYKRMPAKAGNLYCVMLFVLNVCVNRFLNRVDELIFSIAEVSLFRRVGVRPVFFGLSMLVILSGVGVLVAYVIARLKWGVVILQNGHLCPICAYPITGLTSARCPECGYVLSSNMPHSLKQPVDEDLGQNGMSSIAEERKGE